MATDESRAAAAASPNELPAPRADAIMLEDWAGDTGAEAEDAGAATAGAEAGPVLTCFTVLSAAAAAASPKLLARFTTSSVPSA
ncbi:hypothetical protein RP29_06090 [Acidovorax temperans]|uniref:Uncharacterized protein n=1 Tax=Acidovorax temperans TaxID=80878 RepID=A0A0D7KDN4_9BURK|nr:hypothetical protein RP29_06090 [Acidovorax temperans]